MGHLRADNKTQLKNRLQRKTNTHKNQLNDLALFLNLTQKNIKLNKLHIIHSLYMVITTAFSNELKSELANTTSKLETIFF